MIIYFVTWKSHQEICSDICTTVTIHNLVQSDCSAMWPDVSQQFHVVVIDQKSTKKTERCLVIPTKP